MDPELLQQLQQLFAQPDATRVAPPAAPRESPPSFLSTLRSALDPTTEGFFDRGVPGFLRTVVEDVQRNPLAALTPVGDFETNMVGQDLSAEGHPFLGGALQGLGAISAAASGVPIVGAAASSASRQAAKAAARETLQQVRRADPTLARAFTRSDEAIVPTPEVEEALSAAGVSTPRVLESDPADFHEAITAASDAHPAGASVTVYSPEEYADMQLYTTPDGLAGYALKGDDIVSVFKHPNAPYRGWGEYAAMQGVSQGGRRLDAFDTVLPDIYSRAGFRATGRVPFNREYAPPGWDYDNLGEPDVVAMVYDPTGTPGGRGQAFTDYDEMINAQQAEVFGSPGAPPVTADQPWGRGTQSPLQYLGDLGAPTDLPPRETARAAAGARLRRDNRSARSRARRVEAIEQGLTPQELADFRGLNSRTRQSVEENYSRLPDPEVFAQAAIRGADSRGWYLGSGQAIRESFGHEAPRFTALLAAMSPQKSVEENLRIALNTWGNWNAAGRPTDEAALRAAIDSNLEADIGNAMRALRATDDEVNSGVPELLNGPKVGPFYANLVGVVEPVVNDTHMARGYGTLPGGVGTKGRTLAQNAMVRNAAKEFERLTGVAVDARELQEMSWSYIRGLTNAAGDKGRALETIEAAILKPEEAFAGGRQLDERVRNSVSIGHLMADPRFADSLERAGIRAPTPRPPTGTPGVDPLSADPNALRDIAERIDLVRQGTPLYELGALLGGGAAVQSQRQRQQEDR